MSKQRSSAILKNHTYDLAVIGAGPAGALAAALASSTGLTTILIERNKQQPKICGGFISRRSLSLIPKEVNLHHPSFQKIHQLKICMNNRTYSYQSEQALGLLVMRADFDDLLIDYACNRGAIFCEETKPLKIEKVKRAGQNRYLLTLTGKNSLEQVLQTRYLIGADGAFGSSARLSGMRRKKGLTGWGIARICANENDNLDPASLNFYPLPLLGGMGWSFHAQGWTNRGAGGLVRPKKLVKTYHTLFPEDSGNINLPAWPLPFLGPVKKAASGNMMLIGDAAGLVEPFSGEGIFNALLSATLAVRALIQANEYGCSAEPFYRNSFNKYFRNKYPATLAGAILLHAISLVSPSRLPRKIAALMENSLWFNCKINTDRTSADRVFQ